MTLCLQRDSFLVDEKSHNSRVFNVSFSFHFFFYFEILLVFISYFLFVFVCFNFISVSVKCLRARRRLMKTPGPIRFLIRRISIRRRLRWDRRPSRSRTTSRVASRRVEAAVTAIAVKRRQQQPLGLSRPEAEAAGWADSSASLSPRRK